VRVIADENACEGHGLCEATAPDVFEVNDEGMVRVRVDPIPDSLVQRAKSGVRACPVAALAVEDS
jgi:ferredoxin